LLRSGPLHITNLNFGSVILIVCEVAAIVTKGSCAAMITRTVVVKMVRFIRV